LLYHSPTTVANHLTLNELWRRAKKAKDPIEKDRFLAVYHAKRGLTAKEIARIIPNTPRWVQETARRYNQEGIEASKEQQKPKPEGSFPRPSLGYPVAYPLAPEASFLLSLPAGFMRRGQGILGNVLHAGPRSRTFYGLPLSKGIFCEMETCTSPGSSRTMEA
jgi:hypothetical protein